MRTNKRIAVGLGVAALACVTVSSSPANALFALDWAKKAYNKAADVASSAVNSVKETASSVVNKVEEKASSAVDWVKEKATEAKNFATETATKVVEKTKEVAGKAWDATKAAGKKAWNTAKEIGGKAMDYAKKGWDKVKKTAKDVGGGIAAGAKWVGNKAKEGAKAVVNAVMSIGDFVGKYGKKVVAWVQQKYNEYAPKIVGFLKDLAMKGLNALAAALESKYPDAAAIIQKVRNGDFLGAVGEAAVLAANKGRPKLIDWLADQAMRVLQPLLVKANGFLVGLALKVIRSPVSTAIATAIASVVASAAAAVTAGIGAVLGPILQPLTKMTADTILDWAIDKVKDKIGQLLFEQTKPIIKNNVIKPLVNAGFDKLFAFLKRKFPKVFGNTQQLDTQSE
jgi:hypothetical protein